MDMFHQSIRGYSTDFDKISGRRDLLTSCLIWLTSRILGWGGGTYLYNSWCSKLIAYITLNHPPPPHLAMVNSHLTVLESSSSAYASATLFRTPQLDSTSGQVKEWRSISYQQFHRDVEIFAQHWSNVFVNSRIPRRSIIGLWWALTITSRNAIG